MTSLAVTPFCKRPFNTHFHGFGLTLQQALGRQNMFHFTGSNSKSQSAKSSMCGSVTVSADDCHPGLGQALFRPDDMDNTLVRVVQYQTE